MLKGERSLRQQSQQTGMNDWRLWRERRRFRRDGLLGLIDRRTLPPARGTPGAAVCLPRHIQQLIGRRALAHPCTAREWARIMRGGYHDPVDHRGIPRVLARHHLSPEALPRHRHRAPQIPSLPWPPGHQLGLPFEPAAHAQRLELAWGPEPLLIRFRTDREDPTDEQARWRIIEWLESGFRPRRVAALLAIAPPVVSSWQRRFKAEGLLGLSTRPREHPSISTRVPVQVIMEVFQLLDHNPLLGHDRVKMALDALGDRYGHTSVWPMVALDKEAHPPAPPPQRPSHPDERPQHATAPHQVCYVDVRYLAKIAGHWLYSSLLFDGYRRASGGAGCFARQHLSRVVHVCRPAIARWGAPEAVVSDHAGGCLARSPCLHQLGSRWAPMARGPPWPNLAEGGFSIPRRLLAASVAGCTDRETVYRQHAPFVQDHQFWGHWAHTRRDPQGRMYYLSPEVILGNARGAAIEPTHRRRVFRRRQLTRQVRQQGHMRLHHVGIDVDQNLWGQTIEGLIDDDVMRIEQAEHLLGSSPCVDDPRQRRITAVDERGRHHDRHVQIIPLM